MTDIAADPAPSGSPSGEPKTFRRVPVLNVYVDDISMDDLLEVREGAIATLHADMIVKLQHDRDFYDIWDTFDIVTCDSQFIYFVLKLMRRGVCMRVSGSDYFPRFYTRYANDPSITVFLCGGAPGVAEKAQADINAKVGRDIIVGTASPSFDFHDGAPEIDAMIEQINSSGATVLLVALGAGRQEKWIATNRHRLPNVKLFLPLGGTIDYEAAAVKRPPAFVTNLALEWLWRLVREPKRRWRRYVLHDPQVIPYLVRDAFGKYRNPFAK
jgi:exopolysaccharide biosynthesis WecB/TagA/CpsF family protein